MGGGKRMDTFSGKHEGEIINSVWYYPEIVCNTNAVKYLAKIDMKIQRLYNEESSK